MSSTDSLGSEQIHKLLLKYSVPAIVGMMINALYNVVDRIFIGNSEKLSHEGLAGITISFPIMILMLAVGILLGTGGATLFSIRLGEKRREDAEQAMGNAFMLMLIIGVLFSVAGLLFLNPILHLFGASDKVMPYAVDYMRVILIGTVFQIVGLGMNNFIRADGRPKFAMITMFFSAGLNIVLDPIFIFVFDMGMAGAALATILAQGVAAVWVVVYFCGPNSNTKLRLKHLKLSLPITAKITSLGLPGFLLQFANSILNMVLNKGLLSYGGDIAVSGMGIINSLQTLLVLPIIGLKQGMLPIISYNYGARQYKRVKRTVLLTIAAGTGIAIIGFLLINLVPQLLISAFNRDPELLSFSSRALRTWLFALPVVAFQIISANFFQAIGRPYSATLLTLSRQVILLIPAVLIFPMLWGLDGILYAAPFADILSAGLTGVWFWMGLRKLDIAHETDALRKNKIN